MVDFFWLKRCSVDFSWSSEWYNEQRGSVQVLMLGKWIRMQDIYLEPEDRSLFLAFRRSLEPNE